MDLVEKAVHNGPVIIGYGTKRDGGALLTAGADKVLWHPECKDVFTKYAGAAVRDKDTLLVVQPSLLSVADYVAIRDGAHGGAKFQVVGREPVSLASEDEIKAFRRTKAKGARTELSETTGRPRKIKYTVEQADAIIRLWHEVPKRKPAEILRIVEGTILNVEAGTVSKHWVRDLVTKYVGTAQREKPAGWRGVRID